MEKFFRRNFSRKTNLSDVIFFAWTNRVWAIEWHVDRWSNCCVCSWVKMDRQTDRRTLLLLCKDVQVIVTYACLGLGGHSLLFDREQKVAVVATSAGI